MSYDKKLKADSGRKDKLFSNDNLSNKASRVNSSSGYSSKIARRAYENARSDSGEYTEGEVASDIVDAGVSFGSKVVTGGYSSRSPHTRKANSRQEAKTTDSWKAYHDSEVAKLNEAKEPTDSWKEYYDGEIAKLNDKGAGKEKNKKQSKRQSDRNNAKRSESKKNKATKDSNVKGNVSRKYSDKVFNQSKYQFSKRQKEKWEERKQGETVSFFDEINGKSAYENEAYLGKYSKKLKPSKEKKTLDKKEGGKNSRKESKDNNANKKRSKRDERKRLEKRMNERAQFERRYEKMREIMSEANFLTKKAKKKVLEKTRKYVLIGAVLASLLLILTAVISGVSAALIGSFGGSGLTAGITSNLWGSNRREIDKAEEYFYKKVQLMNDEIKFIRGSVSHEEAYQEGDLKYDHFAFMCYLHAKHDGRFLFDPGVERELDRLFDEWFSYSYSVGTEERERTYLDPDTGTWETDTIDVVTLRIVINRADIDEYAADHLNPGQYDYYLVTRQLDGGLQAFGPPANRWMSLPTEYYTSDEGSMTVGTTPGKAVYAMRNGIVTEVGSDYIKVEGEDGASYMISGITGITLSVGDNAVRGLVIGTTRQQMSISEWIDGEAINPLFYTRRE